MSATRERFHPLERAAPGPDDSLVHRAVTGIPLERGNLLANFTAVPGCPRPHMMSRARSRNNHVCSWRKRK